MKLVIIHLKNKAGMSDQVEDLFLLSLSYVSEEKTDLLIYLLVM